MNITEKDKRELIGAPEAERTLSSATALQFLFIASALALLYLPVMKSLVLLWWRSDDYSHGFAVPFIFLYMIWAKREALLKAVPSPDLVSGVPLTVIAGLMLVASKLGRFTLLGELSLIVMAAGLTALLFGRRHLRILLLPIAYLLFMVKLFGDGPEDFHWPFQLLAANIGVWLLQTFGFPAFREAQFIQLPNITLEVASACSGLRFLVSIIAIGVPLANFTQKGLARKTGLVAIAVITAIIANGLRVALIGVWTHYGKDAVHGPFHVFQGVFVAWLGFAVLFIGAWFMSGAREASGKAEKTHLKAFLERMFASAAGTRKWISAWTAASVIISSAGAYYYLFRMNPVELENDLRSIPAEIGGWSATALDAGTDFIRVPGADKELARVYTDPSGRTVDLYIGYFEKEEQDRKLLSFRTSWRFHRGERRMEIKGGALQVNRVVLRDGARRKAVVFWYDLDGKAYSSRYLAKARSLWNAMTSGRSNGALIAVSASLGEAANPEEEFTRLEEFALSLDSSVRDHFPKGTI